MIHPICWVWVCLLFFFNVQNTNKYKTKSGYNANCYFLADESLQLRVVIRPNLCSVEVSEVLRHHLQKSAHFTSSDPRYIGSCPGFLNPSSPPSAFSLCHLIKQNTNVKKTKNLRGGLDFLLCQVSNKSDAEAAKKWCRECICWRCAHQKWEGQGEISSSEQRLDGSPLGLKEESIPPTTLAPPFHQHKPLHRDFVNEPIQLNWDELQVQKSVLLISTVIATGCKYVL